MYMEKALNLLILESNLCLLMLDKAVHGKGTEFVEIREQDSVQPSESTDI